MTTDQARELADELQTRAAHMGDRTGEGLYLGRSASALTDLATQLDDVEGLEARVVALKEKARVEAEAAATLAAPPVTEDAPAEPVNDKKPRGKRASE